jgi:parallel beta-helix repeat protein
MRSMVIGIVIFLSAALQMSAQCVMSCPTSDEVAVQAQLDAAAAGGTASVVQITQPVLNICSSLIVGSNTHFRGATRGGTIVRAVTGYVGRTVNGSYVSSLVGSVGSDNVTISDMTVDVHTCGVHANNVSLLPTTSVGGAPYDGTPVTNAKVENVEIHGTPGFHSYLLWNLRGRHIKFVNNWLDGHSVEASAGGANQEGLESYGGYDVLMSGNSVKNIGYACATLGSGDITDSDTHGLRIVNNHLSDCTIGIQLTASGVFNGESNALTLLSGNQIVDSRQAGIDVVVNVGALERALQISRNMIDGVSSALGSGIRIRTNGGLAIDPDSSEGVAVDHNYIADVLGANSFGLYLLNFPNVSATNNTIFRTASDGIRVYNSSDAKVSGNKITGAGNAAIGVYRTGSLTSERVLVEDNSAFDWSPLTSAIFITGTSRGTVRDNKFYRTDAATPSPINVTSSSCGFKIGNNEPWYLSSYTQPTSSACP